jgi:hypothetical protein
MIRFSIDLTDQTLYGRIVQSKRLDSDRPIVVQRRGRVPRRVFGVSCFRVWTVHPRPIVACSRQRPKLVRYPPVWWAEHTRTRCIAQIDIALECLVGEEKLGRFWPVVTWSLALLAVCSRTSSLFRFRPHGGLACERLCRELGIGVSLDAFLFFLLLSEFSDTLLPLRFHLDPKVDLLLAVDVFTQGVVVFLGHDVELGKLVRLIVVGEWVGRALRLEVMIDDEQERLGALRGFDGQWCEQSQQVDVVGIVAEKLFVSGFGSESECQEEVADASRWAFARLDLFVDLGEADGQGLGLFTLQQDRFEHDLESWGVYRGAASVNSAETTVAQLRPTL